MPNDAGGRHPAVSGWLMSRLQRRWRHVCHGCYCAWLACARTRCKAGTFTSNGLPAAASLDPPLLIWSAAPLCGHTACTPISSCPAKRSSSHAAPGRCLLLAVSQTGTDTVHPAGTAQGCPLCTLATTQQRSHSQSPQASSISEPSLAAASAPSSSLMSRSTEPSSSASLAGWPAGVGGVADALPPASDRGSGLSVPAACSSTTQHGAAARLRGPR